MSDRKLYLGNSVFAEWIGTAGDVALTTADNSLEIDQRIVIGRSEWVMLRAFVERGEAIHRAHLQSAP